MKSGLQSSLPHPQIFIIFRLAVFSVDQRCQSICICIILVDVHMPPQASVQEAQHMLVDQILLVEQTNLDSLVIVRGDFNEGNLSHELPRYRQKWTREEKILDHCYTTVSRAYHAVPHAALGHIRSRYGSTWFLPTGRNFQHYVLNGHTHTSFVLIQNRQSKRWDFECAAIQMLRTFYWWNKYATGFAPLNRVKLTEATSLETHSLLLADPVSCRAAFFCWARKGWNLLIAPCSYIL